MPIKPTDSANGFIQIIGIDAEKFLQGQLTCDVRLANGASCLGAHCNPQGRIISLFILLKFNDAFYLILPRSMIDIALPALKKYAVFFKVQLSDIADEKPVAALANITDEAAWHRTNINAGIPAIYPETSGKFLPHELNLDKLGALNFDKGCYTGQEIIARMHYRGKLKTHLYRARLDSATRPQPGTDIFSRQGQTVCGTVVDSCQIEYNSYTSLIV